MTNALHLRVETERDITALSAFRTPAKTAFFLEVASKDDLLILSQAVARAKSEGLPVAYLGDGTNCLFAFDRFPGLMVKNALSGFRYLSDDAEGATNAQDVAPKDADMPMRFEVRSAEKVHPVALVLATRGNVALIPWIGLPGSFG